jgi:hypothetical protein
LTNARVFIHVYGWALMLGVGHFVMLAHFSIFMAALVCSYFLHGDAAAGMMLGIVKELPTSNLVICRRVPRGQN